MSGSFSIGGLVTGLNSNQIITQLMSIERAPLQRLQQRAAQFEQQRDAVRTVRNSLLTLRNRVQDFRLTNLFNQFQSTSSDEEVLAASVSGNSPVAGSYVLNVTQLASASTASSSAKIGAPINTAATLNASGITTDISAGEFSINGVDFTVDPATNSLDSIITAINSSAAGVTASYNATTDRLTIQNTNPNNTAIINFSATDDDPDDDSNFLTAVALTQATQSTNVNGSTEVSSTRNLGAIDAAELLNTVNFAGGAMTSGTFKINGVSIAIDTATDSVSDVLGQINDSGAGVTASYDTSTDTIRLTSNTLGSRTIAFESGTSNFLNITNLATATQTAGNDSQFTINGGPVLTRNSNEVADAVGGVTLRFLSQGTSTVTVSVDDDAIVEDVQEFLTAFNESVTAIRDQIASGAILESDGTLRQIEDFLRGTIFNQVAGISGAHRSLAELGITTGDSFDSSTISPVEVDEETFREALRENRGNIQDIFSNSGGTGIADQFFSYLDQATATTGYLNDRIKSNGSIDQQIEDINDRIARTETRLAQKETRLRMQFTRLETMASQFQSQGASLSGIQSAFRSF